MSVGNRYLEFATCYFNNIEPPFVNRFPRNCSFDKRQIFILESPVTMKKEKSPTGAKILTSSVGGRKTYHTDEVRIYINDILNSDAVLFEQRNQGFRRRPCR